MKMRYMIHNKTLGIGCEAVYNAQGQEALKALRKSDERFKRRRIREAIQACPEEIPLEDGRSKVYDLI